jgi:hypothetical protein
METADSIAPGGGTVPTDDNIKLAQSVTDFIRNPSLEQSVARLSRTSQEHDNHARENQKKLLQEVFHMGGLMKDQLDAFERFTNESGLQPPIQWESFRPPLTYHPVNFFNSLEDTPEKYKYTELRKYSVPLSLHDKVLDRPEKLEEDEKAFGKQDLYAIMNDQRTRELLFIFDIKATRRDEDDQGFTWEIKDYRYNDWKECAEKEEAKMKDCKERIVWALYDSVRKPCAVLAFMSCYLLTLPIACRPRSSA